HRHEADESCEGTAVERPGRWRVDPSFTRAYFRWAVPDTVTCPVNETVTVEKQPLTPSTSITGLSFGSGVTTPRPSNAIFRGALGEIMMSGGSVTKPFCWGSPVPSGLYSSMSIIGSLRRIEISARVLSDVARYLARCNAVATFRLAIPTR